MADQMLAAALELPGGSWSKIREKVTGNATDSANVRDRLISDGLLINTSARHGYFCLWHHDDPASSRSELGTGLERLTDPSSPGGAEPSRSPVPTLSRNGERNGTAPTMLLPGDDGYLEQLWPVFENGHVTSSEWTQLERVHQRIKASA